MEKRVTDTILRMNVLKTTDGEFSCCNAINMQFLLSVQKKQQKNVGGRRKLTVGEPKIDHSFFVTF
jgi:hypothetical protein